MHLSPTLLAPLALALAASPAAAQIDIEPGLASSAQVVDAGAFHATLSDGRSVRAGAQDIDLLAADGSLLSTLASFPSAVFPSFVLIDPTETFAIVGESSNGEIVRVDLAGGMTPITTLTNNYDAHFDQNPNFLIVSASTGDFSNPRNRIWRVNIQNGNRRIVARVGGFSGPVAVHPQSGDLYYPLGNASFGVDVAYWTRAQVDSGLVLTDADATPFSLGYPGALSMRFDLVSAHLVLVELDFGGPPEVWRIGSHGERLGAAATIQGGTFPGDLELIAGSERASFQPYQPENVRLRFTDTDFGTGMAQRVELRPARATATLDAPVAGAGTVTLTIEGAVPNAAVQLYFGSASDVQPSEVVYAHLFGFPFHSALALPDVRRMPLLTPTDANGSATFQFYDPGTLAGTLVFQSLVLDATATPLGSSSHVLN